MMPPVPKHTSSVKSTDERKTCSALCGRKTLIEDLVLENQQA
jgi:hypothetical protein